MCIEKIKIKKTLKIIIIFTAMAFVSFEQKRREMSVHAQAYY